MDKKEPTIVTILKNKADIGNRRAIRELEHRGFKFGTHFGYANAYTRLLAMELAIAEGRLYEHLALTYGPGL